MTSLFDRLEKEEAIVRGELDALREKISVVEERLIRLTITRDTLRSLSTDGAPHADTDPADDSSPLDLDGEENQPAEAAYRAMRRSHQPQSRWCWKKPGNGCLRC